MRLFNFFNKNKGSLNYTEKTDLIGIYNIDNHDEVKLVELVINENINDFDAGQITQEIKKTDRLNWQTAYDEKYLDLEGNKVIGDDFDKPKKLTEFRIVFFFHNLDLTKPLITQYGLIRLSKFENLPKRLSDLINYETVD